MCSRSGKAVLAADCAVFLSEQHNPAIRGAARSTDRRRRPAVAFFWRARGKMYQRARAAGPSRQAGVDAGVAELVDAPDLGSGGESRGGSSPSARTSGGSLPGRSQARLRDTRWRGSDDAFPTGRNRLSDSWPVENRRVGHAGDGDAFPGAQAPIRHRPFRRATSRRSSTVNSPNSRPRSGSTGSVRERCRSRISAGLRKLGDGRRRPGGDHPRQQADRRRQPPSPRPGAEGRIAQGSGRDRGRARGARRSGSSTSPSRCCPSSRSAIFRGISRSSG